MKVLLVEDNAILQRHVSELISEIPGASIVNVVDNEAQASKWLLQNPDGWDLAVIDLFLREGHGFNVLRTCRLRQKHQRAVMFSNYSRYPAPQRAMEEGADEFFDKVQGMDQLVAYVERFTAGNHH